MARSVGTVARTTNGTATRAWASGTRAIEVRRSTGTSSATRKPNPIVTADVPSGSMSTTSNHRERAPRPLATIVADARPTATATAAATSANTVELTTASAGRMASEPGSARKRHPDPPPRRLRATRTSGGTASSPIVPPTTADTTRRSAPERGLRSDRCSGTRRIRVVVRSWNRE